MKSVILFRRDLDSEGEFDTAGRYLPTMQYRTDIGTNQIVFGRYSVLPYYRELEQELIRKGSGLINSADQHEYIADVTRWANLGGALHGLTPPAYTTWGDLPEGQYVVKGRTNSRKHQWATHMFAPNRAAIPRIAQRLFDDALINEQGLVVRPYVPLKKLGDGLNGLPITNEWRTFWLKTPRSDKPRNLGVGFYWASHPELEAEAYFSRQMTELAFMAAGLIAQHVNFFVLDVAEKEDGEAIIVEVNDGQMSGLSCIPAVKLYGELSRAAADFLA